jgi:catechol 2,3-dioxygenase-like lactoylglutathione lyase family enzyme
MTQIASLVLFANDLDATAAFYRAAGLTLEDEHHDDGPVHVAAELAGVHFAIYAADHGIAATAGTWRAAGTSFPGIFVESLDSVTVALAGLGAPLLAAHQTRPWGCRIVVQDPDGRQLEINQRGHCPDLG